MDERAVSEPAPFWKPLPKEEPVSDPEQDCNDPSAYRFLADRVAQCGGMWVDNPHEEVRNRLALFLRCGAAFIQQRDDLLKALEGLIGKQRGDIAAADNELITITQPWSKVKAAADLIAKAKGEA